MVIGTSGWGFPIVNWIGGVLWVIRAGGWVPIMPWVVGCSYSGVSRKALRLRFRLTSVPRHGFKVLWGCGSPLPSSGSVLPGWWCAWSRGWVSSDSYYLPLSDGFTYYGRGAGVMPQLVLGLWVTG